MFTPDFVKQGVHEIAVNCCAFDKAWSQLFCSRIGKKTLGKRETVKDDRRIRVVPEKLSDDSAEKLYLIVRCSGTVTNRDPDTGKTPQKNVLQPGSRQRVAPGNYKLANNVANLGRNSRSAESYIQGDIRRRPAFAEFSGGQPREHLAHRSQRFSRQVQR